MAFLIRRLGGLVFVLFGMSVVMFVVSRSLPADPTRLALGEYATREMIDNYRREVGLDQPLPVQYLLYLGRLVRGDLGTSIANRQPVLHELGTFLPATIELALASLILSCFIGVPLGILSAVANGRWVDHVSRVVSLFAMSMPIFWLGLVYQFLFYGQLGWLPAGGRLGQFTQPPPNVTGL